MDALKTQQLLFNHIKAVLPTHISFVDEVAHALNISNDSAYRRIRGEKPIGLDELQVLCGKYNISLDQLLHIQTNTVIFSGNKVDSVSFGFNDYLQDIVNHLLLFKSLQNPHIYYYNKDIPIFHYMPFAELRAFKFFFWKRTIVGYPELARMQFKAEDVDEEATKLAKQIIELYTSIPSTEIWNEENVHSSIRQIEFYAHSNVFADKQTLEIVYDQLEQVLNHLELQAEAGKKVLLGGLILPTSATYSMHINECLLGDNTIFVNSDNVQITCLNHNGLNFTATRDKSFGEYTYKNLQNIIRKSTHISLVGEKERNMFFNRLRSKIYDSKKNIL